VILEGLRVRLEPLEAGHAEALVAAADDGELWRSTVTVVPSRETIARYVARALEERANGRQYPFVIFHKASARVIGTTRYMNIEEAHRGREIGSTWIGASHQRSGVNTECKLLLLAHAFEQLGCIRVEFKTDVLNVQSREAILRLGAKEEGILRNHMIMPGGRLRDSACYSIVAAEWPSVRRRLEERLARGASAR
jgi:RimJ/RimL family protein N-acetyltransferase